MAEHTPGPWRVLEWASEKKGFIAVVGPGDPPEHICDVFPFGKRAEGQSLAEHTANARLIAAAPEMLAALQALVSQILDYERVNNLSPNPGRKNCWDSVTTAQAAIAKAIATQPQKEPT